MAIFASGNGTNCENIIRYFQDSEAIRVALVVSDKSQAYVLQRAERLQVETRVIIKADLGNPEIVQPLLHNFNIQFIVLAGFLQMIPAYLIQAYQQRMINIHPSLLPKFGGKGMYGRHVHEAVFMAREKETGMTVHWVSEQCDGGEIIAQYKTPLSPSDTIETIAAKEHELEMTHFPKVIEDVIQDCCRLQQQR